MQEYKVTDDVGTVWYRKPDTDILHRLDGPAIELADGSKCWYVNGKCHRTDGPAVEHADGYKAWYVNGNRHRTDGPAVEWADGSVEYYIEGEKYSKEEFLAKTAPAKEMTMAQLEKVLLHKVKIIK